MKKHLITVFSLAALTGLVQADATLLYSYDFETLVGSIASANNNLAPTPGTGEFTQSGGPWVNWADGALGSDRSHEAKPGGGKLTLTGTGENGSLGVNTTDGFTLAFFFKDTSSAQYSTIFQLNATEGNISSRQDSAATASTKFCQFYNNGNNIDNWNSFRSEGDFVHVALTFQDGTLTGYANGTRFLTADNVAFSGELTSINFGTANSVQASYDNIQLYSGLLTQSEIAALVPEPTSASLGLLGFSLLAFRRKRKN